MMMTVFSKLTFVCNHSYNHSTIASRLLRLRYCKSNIDQFLFMTCLCVHPRERERERENDMAKFTNGKLQNQFILRAAATKISALQLLYLPPSQKR